MSFLGISSSIVNQAGNTIGGWLKNPFNRSFFFWYYFPALAYILFNRFLVLPVAFGISPPNFVDYANTVLATQPNNPAAPDSTPGAYFVGLLIDLLGADVLWFIVAPFVIGVMLHALSFQITRLYEGFVPPLSWLLKPWQTRNLKLSHELYGPLSAKRLEYLRLHRAEQKLAADKKPSAEEKKTLDDTRRQLRELRRDIQALHETAEAKADMQQLPADPKRVTATALGNTLAVSEEYAFDRYGIDSVLFWTRLRAELDDETLQPIDSAKGVLDGMLNFSVLAYIGATEAIVVMFFRKPVALTEPLPVVILLASALLSLAVGYNAYRGGVNAAYNMGQLLRTYFDYYRTKVLDKFGIKKPDSLEEEKLVWFKLGAFLRRGESFYFPKDTDD